MRLDHLLSKEKEESFEARYFIGNFKIPREKFIVYFSMYFLFKYIEISIYVALLEVLSDASKK